MVRVWRGAGLAILVAVGLAVSACGAPAGSEPAAKLMPKVQAAAEAATSVHVVGSVTQKGETTTLDVSFSGTSAAGSIGTYGTSFYVLLVDRQSFVKLNPAFLAAENAPASLCAKVCGKYVSLPADSTLLVATTLSMQELIQAVFSTRNMHVTAASGCVFSPATFHGQPVLQCHQGASTLDVAARGQPYLVYWGGTNGQYLAFSDWNSVRLPPLPPASQVVSLSVLG